MNKESVLGYSPKELEQIPNYILYIKMLEQLKATLDNIENQTSYLNNTLRDLVQIIRNK